MAHPPRLSQTLPAATPCRYCGAVDTPALAPGTAMHPLKASCRHCGRFWRWISLRAPHVRRAQRHQAVRAAMEHKAPSAAQLAFLQALGFEGPAPATMAQASEMIEALKAATEARNTKTPGWHPQGHMSAGDELG